MQLHDYIEAKISAADLQQLPLFYRQIFQYFNEIRVQENVNPQNISRQIIWLNENIQIGKRTVFYEDWYEVGVKYIGDLLDNHTFLSYLGTCSSISLYTWLSSP